MLYENPDIFAEKNLLNSSQIKSIAQFNNSDLSWQDYSCICKKNSIMGFVYQHHVSPFKFEYYN